MSDNPQKQYHGYYKIQQKGNTRLRVFIPPEIEEIEDRLTKLEAENASLKNRIEELEAKIK
jgi:hypothetical protein